MARETKLILAEVKRRYWGLNWPGIYTYWRYWEYPRYLKMEKMLPRKGVIIDLGCGYGIFTNFMAAAGPKRKIIALEANQKKIELAKRGFTNVAYITQDIAKAEIPPAEAVVLMHVLHHLSSFEEQEELLKAVVKKLKKGGTLLIDEVDNRSPWRRRFGRVVDWLLYPFEPIFYRFEPEMTKLLQKYPLKLVKVAKVDGPLMPFSEVVYLCRRK